ncbi:MAG: hypothetical protein ABSC15_21875 [Terriglobales bacterium]
MRVLGAIAKVLPEVMTIESVEKFINQKLKSELKVTSARNAFDRFSSVDVKAGVGNPEDLFKFDLPRWEDMRCGVSIKGQPQGGAFADPVTGKVGGFRPARNELFNPTAGGELRHLHQVHAVLAELSGCRVRCHHRGHL